MPNVNVTPPGGGAAVSIPESALAQALKSRYTIEAPAAAADRAVAEGRGRNYQSFTQTIRAALKGGLDGATLGLSTAVEAATAGEGGREDLNLLREHQGTAFAAGQIGGTLATAIPGAVGKGTLGALARATPTGIVSRGGARIAERGVGKGIVKETAAAAVGGAVEGGLQQAGQYFAETALADKELSAEGFWGSLGKGAMWGGAGGGLFGLTSSTLTSAKKLFPAGEVTEQAATQAERKAAVEIDGALRDGDELEALARARARDYRHARVATDPAAAQAAEAARLKAMTSGYSDVPRPIGDDADQAFNRTANTLEAKAIASRPAPPKPKRGRKGKAAEPQVAEQPSQQVSAGVQPGQIGTGPAAADDLSGLLAQSTARLKAGDQIGDLTAAARRPGDVERAIDDAVGDLDPGAARLRSLADEHAAARKDLADLLKSDKVDPREYAATLRRQADAKRGLNVESGKRSRLDDTIENPLAGRDPIPGTTTSHTRGFERTSKLRNPYTDAELAARREVNPTFRDRGDMWGGAPSATTARSDLVDRILSGRTTAANLEIETLAPRAGGELEAVGQQATSQEVLDAIRRQKPDLSADVMSALRGRLDLPDDLPRVVPAIQRLERAEADLVDALAGGGVVAGIPAAPVPGVPVGSARRAGEWRTAMDSHAEARSLGDLQAAQAVSAAAAAPIAVQQAGKGFLGSAADLGAALEVMGGLGIPGLPSARDIPVIGPLLGMYLKARAATAVWRRMGGKMGASTETGIASRAAATRDRVRAAVHQLVDSGAKAARGARVAAPTAAVILSRRLFADDEAKKHREDDKAPIAQLWADRSRELARALEPGAMAQSLRDRVRTSDPRLAAAIEDSALRRARYLDAKIPRPPPGGSLGSKTDPWRPAAAEVERFARIVEAVDDPVTVLERAIDGDISVDAIEAIREVYPKLYAEAQMTLMEAALERDDIPYRRRVQLGILFGLPMDPTQEPAFVAKMQAGFPPPAATAPPPAPVMPAAPSPGIAAPVDLAAGMLLQEMR